MPHVTVLAERSKAALIHRASCSFEREILSSERGKTAMSGAGHPDRKCQLHAGPQQLANASQRSVLPGQRACNQTSRDACECARKDAARLGRVQRGYPQRGTGKNLLKVKFRVFSGCFSGVLRKFSGYFQAVFRVFFPLSSLRVSPLEPSKRRFQIP